MRIQHTALTFFVSLVMLALPAVLLTVPAHACSCAGPVGPQQALSQSTSVFRGVAKTIESDLRGYSKTVRFEASEVWKGEVGAIFEVGTAGDSAACGIDFEIGKEYLVYTYGAPSSQLTGLCSRTTLITAAADDLRTLGRGQTIQTIGGSSSSRSSSDSSTSYSSSSSYTTTSAAPVPNKPVSPTASNDALAYIGIALGVLNLVGLAALASYTVQKHTNKK